MQMSRYARPTLDIRFLRHYLGAYLRNESEVEKQASKSPAASLSVTDREQAKFIFSWPSKTYEKPLFVVRALKKMPSDKAAEI